MFLIKNATLDPFRDKSASSTTLAELLYRLATVAFLALMLQKCGIRHPGKIHYLADKDPLPENYVENMIKPVQAKYSFSRDLLPQALQWPWGCKYEAVFSAHLPFRADAHRLSINPKFYNK